MPDREPTDQSQILEKQSLRFARWSCRVVILLAILESVCWILHFPLLLSWSQTLPAIQPNTIVGLLLIALGIEFSVPGKRLEMRRLIASSAALLVCLLGLLTLAEYSLRLDLGIDHVFTHAVPDAMQPYPGRPSPQTSANFVLMGAALLFYSFRLPRIRLGQTLTIAAGINAIVAMSGYVFETKEFYGFPVYGAAVGMAIDTAVEFVILAFALMSSRPHRGFISLFASNTRAGAIARRILITIVLAPPAIGLLTRVGVHEAWYDQSVQISIFVVILVTIIFQSTWQALRRAEQEEIRATHAQNALLEREADLKEAQRLAHVGSWNWDAHSGKVEWSEELYRIVGRDPKEWLPRYRDMASLCTPESAEQLQSAMENLLRDGTAYEIELEIVRADGTSCWISARGEALRDRLGRITGIHGTAQDITPFKDFQRMREEWTSVIAHDLRQPIAVIKMSAEILPKLHAGKMLADEQATGQRILAAAQSLSRMVDDLLDISRMEAHRLVLEKRWEDPRKLVRESVAQTSNVTAGFIVRITESGALSPVYLDAVRIEQVLTNLISNAAKYGKKGTEIVVKLLGRPVELEISVTNYGKGIPRNELSRLFSRFTRASSARESGAPGLGLGLYIAKGLVEAHGGKIWVESTPHETTSFHFVLPLVETQKQLASA